MEPHNGETKQPVHSRTLSKIKAIPDAKPRGKVCRSYSQHESTGRSGDQGAIAMGHGTRPMWLLVKKHIATLPQALAPATHIPQIHRLGKHARGLTKSRPGDQFYHKCKARNKFRWREKPTQEEKKMGFKDVSKPNWQHVGMRDCVINY